MKAQKPISDRKAVEGNPDGPLAGESVVFTGALSIPRREAEVLAAEGGCDVTPSVGKKTTIVVVGQQDLRRLEGHNKSRKHRKAEARIAEGQSLKIVGEEDFLRLLGLQESEV